MSEHGTGYSYDRLKCRCGLCKEYRRCKKNRWSARRRKTTNLSDLKFDEPINVLVPHDRYGRPEHVREQLA